MKEQSRLLLVDEDQGLGMVTNSNQTFEKRTRRNKEIRSKHSPKATGQ